MNGTEIKHITGETPLNLQKQLPFLWDFPGYYLKNQIWTLFKNFGYTVRLPRAPKPICKNLFFFFCQLRIPQNGKNFWENFLAGSTGG